jgi:uncharacterized protein YdiU (UPF0061 family)
MIALILGERIVEGFYSYLRRDFGLGRKEIAVKPDVFSKAMEQAFGRAGQVIQKMIVRDICSKLGMDHGDLCDHSLAQALVKLKEQSRSNHNDVASNLARWRRIQMQVLP